jgi:cephalosporin hydroxylase
VDYVDIPYEEHSDRAMPWHTTFIGQGMQHNYWLHAIIDRIMVAETQIQSIIEIGTGAGALTMMFGLWAVKRRGKVLTIDKVNRHDAELFRWLDIDFIETDEMGPRAQMFIDHWKALNEPLLLFCDGGCKRNEFRHYGPQMPVGSIVCAHDLGMEFRHEIDAYDVPGLVKYHPEWWTELNVQLAIYKRV